MTIWVTRNVAEALASEGRRLHPLEAGGVLLGWHDGDDRIVAGLVGAGPASLHGRLAFVPDHAWQIARIHDAFARTSGDLDYLGDWHTHPGGLAEMSKRDEDTLHRIARRVSRAAMLIAAGGPQRWEMGAWTRTRGKFLSRATFQRQVLRVFDAPSDWPVEVLTN